MVNVSLYKSLKIKYSYETFNQQVVKVSYV